jgi:TnpA family transposase
MKYLLKFSFTPRIKNVHKQHLYSGKYPSVYKQKEYLILPEKRFNRKLLEKHWEDILRLVASIKLGEISASQIFKRLNSYSADENSLYCALKEFGRIPKSLYILRYVDDVDLRASVHKQLNKGESGNRLNKALAIGRLR